MGKPADDLEKQIETRRLEIATESYSMSIGELTNLYRDGELDIHPEFQRFFRWDEHQKSRLVESILLGIPLPSIFVAQTSKGAWELVDGLQRVCTILEVQGLLKDEDGKSFPPLKLLGTKFLPALEGKTWDSHSNEAPSLSQAQRLDIKRAKIDVKIIKRESSSTSKYDLFQRLNSYGSQLTAQELRSCMLVSANRAFFEWLRLLVKHPSFVETTALNDRLLDEQYDVELALRFLVLHSIELQAVRSLGNFGPFLDEKALDLATKPKSEWKKLEHVFKFSFDTIVTNGGEDVFRKYSTDRKSFKGAFLNTAFEIFAMGVGFHVSNDIPFSKDLIAAAKKFWSRKEMKAGFATGLSTENRLATTLPVGRDILKQ